MAKNSAVECGGNAQRTGERFIFQSIKRIVIGILTEGTGVQKCGNLGCIFLIRFIHQVGYKILSILKIFKVEPFHKFIYLFISLHLFLLKL